MITFRTSFGDIIIELFESQAPVTTRNFLSYCIKGSYEKAIFHRVIDGFIIQGGGFKANMQKIATEPPICNEASSSLKNSRGTIAMARTHTPDSATSQFFINLNDNHFLDFVDTKNPGYCVFGQVVTGIEIIDQIAKTPTVTKGIYEDVPKMDIIIEEVIVG